MSPPPPPRRRTTVADLDIDGIVRVMAERDAVLTAKAYAMGKADAEARVRRLEAERDEARKRAKTWKAAARSWFASGRFSVGMLRVKDLRRERNEARASAAALADALRALHDIVLMREAGATDLLPDLARAMARARAVMGG
jgi:uncharacterized coiled-coil DUF342 family protein